jgi:hypothetical protein
LQLPPEALKKLFFARLKRGAILKTVLHFPKTGTTKTKFIVLMNKDGGATDPLLFFISTSQLEYYERNPALKSEIAVIEASAMACFPLRTAINCREILVLTRDEMGIRAGEFRVEVVGDLPAELMGRIDKIVAASNLISPADKKKII